MLNSVRSAGRERAGLLAEGGDAMKEQELHVLTDSFMIAASHELRGPLACVSAGLEMLMSADCARTRENQRICLETMRDGVDRLTQVTQRLLDASCATMGRAVLHREKVDLAGLLEMLAPELAALVALRSQAYTVEAPEGLPEILADPVHLGRIVRDLVENASLYSARETTVRLALALREPNAVRLVVQDEGIGIGPEEEHHVFTPFYRGEAARRMTPHGLGLSLAAARAIVEQHGGEIRFVSVPGQGTAFCLDLPIYRDDSANQEGDEAAGIGRSPDPCGERNRLSGS